MPAVADLRVLNQDADRGDDASAELVTSADRCAIKPPEIVRAEANFLRFPFFALHTKRLRERDGIECVGRKHVGDEVHLFKLTVTRNTKHVYPGLLSRKTHVALLSLQQGRGYPYENPIEWTWPELTSRMQISCGGEIESKIKQAIRQTAGVLITSNYALTGAVGNQRHLLPSDEHGYHIYDSYRFRNERLSDGSIAEKNCVWLSDWYLSNLNSFYSGPIHHPTWLALDAESSIASRLYEFLLFNAKATKTLRINYATLANFLPIKLEHYPSDAKRQLRKPFKLARDHGVIDDVTWQLGRRGQLQLVFRLGPRVQNIKCSAIGKQTDWPDFANDIEVRELRNSDSPAAVIVREFHTLWSGVQNYRPTSSELALANELMDRFGRKHVEKLLPKVVRAMRRPDGFPKAKMFTACRAFFTRIATDDAKLRERRRNDEQRALQEEMEDERAREAKQSRKRRRDELLARWKTLTTEARQRIEADAYRRQQGTVLRQHFQKSDSHRLRECLRELDRQIGENAAL